MKRDIRPLSSTQERRLTEPDLTEARVVGWSLLQEGPIIRRRTHDGKSVYHAIKRNGRLQKLAKGERERFA